MILKSVTNGHICYPKRLAEGIVEEIIIQLEIMSQVFVQSLLEPLLCVVHLNNTQSDYKYLYKE